MIGGTRFVGRHFVDAALAHGHDITLFNRGQSNADLYPNVENLRGNRDGDLAALAGGRWDAVVDTCGYVPRVVRQSAELLADKVNRYLFISTISVYEDMLEPGADENAPLQTLADSTVEQVTGETYGGLKVPCEQVVEEIYGERALIVRLQADSRSTIRPTATPTGCCGRRAAAKSSCRGLRSARCR
ncbi:MAG: hypothetical protein U0521_06260 [Anaerolineae bacterium]